MIRCQVRRPSLKKAAWFCLGAVLFVYLSSYIALRNRGLREMHQYEVDGFLYDSVARVERTQDLTQHHILARVYAPLNAIDQWFFGCPGPILGIMFDLS